MTLQNSMWNAKTDRLTKARSEARETRNRNENVSAHSIMLSAYITIMAGGQSAVKSLYYTLLALWHTFVLLRNWRKLSHDQLDVLIQFCLKFRSKLPFVKSGEVFRTKWYPQPGRLLIRLAIRELVLARTTETPKPHQIALAYMTCAEVSYAVDFNKDHISNDIQKALALEEEIGKEENRLFGLRQFVRVLRKAGELYGKEQMYGWQPEKARSFLNRGLALAQGEADTADQAKRIQDLLHRL